MDDTDGVIRTLQDGQTVLVRELRSEDRDLIVDGFAHLSDRSRFLRFLAPRKQLTARELDRLTDPTDRDDVAIGAKTIEPSDVPNTPVGLARFVRLAPGSDVAEIAITVVDDYQGKGVGTVLLRELARIAERCDVREFEALIHSDNINALGFLHHFRAREEDGTQPETEARLSIASILEGLGD